MSKLQTELQDAKARADDLFGFIEEMIDDACELVSEMKTELKNNLCTVRDCGICKMRDWGICKTGNNLIARAEVFLDQNKKENKNED